MKPNDVLEERRSQRAERFRKVANSCRKYKIGFFTCLALLIGAEIDLDLSNQVGERIKFKLNPTEHGSNQSKDCK